MLDKLFKTEYQVLEVPEGTKLPELTQELKDSLKSLLYHPAYNYIILRLRLQKAQVQRYLEEGYKLDDTELRFAQAGLYWLKFIESDLSRLTATPRITREALDDERAEFERISQSLESIGA